MVPCLARQRDPLTQFTSVSFSAISSFFKPSRTAVPSSEPLVSSLLPFPLPFAEALSLSVASPFAGVISSSCGGEAAHAQPNLSICGAGTPPASPMISTSSFLYALPSSATCWIHLSTDGCASTRSVSVELQLSPELYEGHPKAVKYVTAGLPIGPAIAASRGLWCTM